MENWAWPVAALVGLVVGVVAAGEQWRLYSEPAFQEGRFSGRRLFIARALVGTSCAVVAGIAFRPDYYNFGPALLTALFGIVLVILSSTDFERRRLPNRLMYPSLVAAAAFSWAWPDRSLGEIWLGFAVAVGAAALMLGLGLAIGSIAGVRETPFGLGDVKLIVLEGLLLGWPAVLGALFVGVLLAGVPSIFMIVTGKGRKTFSYGPYLAGGCLLVLLFFERFG